MFIRWTFAFDEGSLNVEVRDEKEDERIHEGVANFRNFLLVPTAGKDAYINLRMCKAIIREEVTEQCVITPEAPKAPETPQIAE